ncbi:hypothetical protein [Methylorubrum thiocyanatum]|uniref:hypothetical protein n=1 Tax=Methylorubrum thiocyanatum TaxID=47958 RepID=UPI0035C7EA30
MNQTPATQPPAPEMTADEAALAEMLTNLFPPASAPAADAEPFNPLAGLDLPEV